MSEKQKSFNADLRYPVIDRDGERWSLWKSLAMMELSARETYHFVKTMLPALAHKIVEVGCGDGYLALVDTFQVVNSYILNTKKKEMV